MTENWTSLNKCKTCDSWPIIMPGPKKSKSFICPNCLDSYPSIEDWNLVNPQDLKPH